MKAFARTSSDTSLLRSPTNKRNQAETSSAERYETMKVELTWVPFKQSLVLPHLPSSFSKDSCPLPTFRQFATGSATFINHGTWHIDTLLRKDANVILVSIGWDWGTVRGRRPCNRIHRATVRLVVRVDIIS